MRAPPALLVVIAAIVTVPACSGPGAAVQAKPPAAPAAATQTVGCDQVIQQHGPPGGRLLFGVFAAPPAHLARGAPTGTAPWAYFAKYGIAIRADSAVVLITVPAAWRHRAAISWGNSAGEVSSLRLLSCPRQTGPWNAYAGGFYLRSASGCVPLLIQVGRHAATLSFAIGKQSCASAT